MNANGDDVINEGINECKGSWSNEWMYWWM